LAAVLQIVFVLASPVLQTVLGLAALRRISGWAGNGEIQGGRDLPTAFMLGLLIHLTAIFFLKLIGLFWIPAVLLPLIPPLLWERGVWREFAGAARFRPNLNFVVWFAVILGLGVSLFQTVEGIQTPWTNNYGDLTFHLGMISSFVFGGNFPPEYHIFAGARLSYPIMVNLWSAALWSFFPVFGTLAFIFVFQWTVLWCAVYFFLRGNRWWLAPWAVLLGGGCYGVWGSYSWELIPKGNPWAVFLTTIWVTQRSALFGAAALLAGLHLFFSAFDEDQEISAAGGARERIAGAGLLFALAPLVHTHSWLAGVLFAGLMLGGRGCAALLGRAAADGKRRRFRRYAGYLLTFAAALLPAVIFLPWLVGKSGMVTWMWGWVEGYTPDQPVLENIWKSAKMWLLNAPAWLTVVFVYWAVTQRRLEIAALAALFLLGNTVKLAYWDWDQLKLFIAIYIISLQLWTRENSAVLWRLHWLFLLLMVPAAVECAKIFSKGEQYTVYEQAAVEQAETVRTLTPPDAVFAAAPDHNTLITLTGRKLFAGYDGTLWSHGLDYGERRKILEDPARLCRCAAEREAFPDLVCPDYLLWTGAEQRFWKRPSPPACAREAGAPFIFRLESSK